MPAMKVESEKDLEALFNYLKGKLREGKTIISSANASIDFSSKGDMAKLKMTYTLPRKAITKNGLGIMDSLNMMFLIQEP